MKTNVVIVDADIGGAILALELGRRGYWVVMLERQLSPSRIVRPEILWRPMLRALDQLGLGTEVRDQASIRLGEIDVAGLSGFDRRISQLQRPKPFRQTLF